MSPVGTPEAASPENLIAVNLSRRNTFVNPLVKSTWAPAMEIKSYQKTQAQVRFIPDYIHRIKKLEDEIKSLKELTAKK